MSIIVICPEQKKANKSYELKQGFGKATKETKKCHQQLGLIRNFPTGNFDNVCFPIFNFLMFRSSQVI